MHIYNITYKNSEGVISCILWGFFIASNIYYDMNLKILIYGSGKPSPIRMPFIEQIWLDNTNSYAIIRAFSSDFVEYSPQQTETQTSPEREG